MFHIRRRAAEYFRFVLNHYFNLEVIPLNDHALLSTHLREVLKAHKIGTVIDVGANEGQFASELRRIGFGGTIHSFEPVRASYDALCRAALPDTQWIPHHLALGEKTASAVINVFPQSVFSSLLPANAYGADRFVGMKSSYDEEIKIEALSDVFDRLLIPRGERILLKMDTQGYDLQVLKGAKDVLTNVAALISEVSFIPIYEGMPNYETSLAAFEEAGFCVSGLYPVTRNEDLSLVEMDCILVKRTASVQTTFAEKNNTSHRAAD